MCGFSSLDHYFQLDETWLNWEDYQGSNVHPLCASQTIHGTASVCMICRHAFQIASQSCLVLSYPCRQLSSVIFKIIFLDFFFLFLLTSSTPPSSSELSLLTAWLLQAWLDFVFFLRPSHHKITFTPFWIFVYTSTRSAAFLTITKLAPCK